jgi:23S rRNA-/tRNA-specific pseudouridylate synthase
MLSTAIIMTMMIGCSLHHFQRHSFVVSAKRISTAAYAHRYYTKGQRNVAAFTTRSAASTCVNSSYNSGSNIGSNFGLGIVSSSSPSVFTSSIRDKNTIILETKNGYQPRGFHRLFLSSTTIETSSSDSSDNQEQSGEEKKSSSNYITTKNQGEKFHGKIEQESNSIKYPKGIPDGFYIIQHYAIPDGDTFNDMLQNAIKVTAAADDDTDASKNENDGIIGKPSGITQEELDRLGIANGENVTLPIALMLLDPEEYPSFSKARKACRKGYIIIHRGPLNGNTNDVMEENNSEEADIEQLVEMEEEEYDDDDEGQNSNENLFDLTKCIRGRVADRVYPNDVIGRQVRMHGGFYPGLDCKKPPFDLPVVYEDDHFAIVNKPAGVVVYAQRNQGHGMMTIRSALPFALKPPKRGTLAIIRRPVSVHRLDKPTSGCLLIAKTKPAMVDLSRQFVERRIKKTYTAIVNGIPDEPTSSSITMEDAHKMGVDVGYSTSLPTEAKEEKWQLIDFALDDGNSVKSAVTVWKPLEYVKSLKANDGTLTKVEMKPKTGRYHQLRRHMVRSLFLFHFLYIQKWYLTHWYLHK